MSHTRLKLQKFVPVDREYPIYELIDAEGNVLLDVSRSESGQYEMALHKAGSGQLLDLEEVLELIGKAKTLLAQEEES